MGQKWHKHLQGQKAAQDVHEPTFQLASPGGTGYPSLPQCGRGECQQGRVGQRGGDQRQHPTGKKHTATQGDQATQGVTHQYGRFPDHFLQKTVNLSCPQSIVQMEGWLAGQAESEQVKPVDAPPRGSQYRRVPSPVPAACGKAMQKNQGGVIGVPEVAPMAAMPSPMPFLMLSPIGILFFAHCHRNVC